LSDGSDDPAPFIAQFEDVDDSGDPSVGDVIRTNRYPLDLNDVTGGGTFQTTAHTIIDPGAVIYIAEQVFLGNGRSTVTDTGTNQLFSWGSSATIEQLRRVW
jgi:hypothetical protein